MTTHRKQLTRRAFLARAGVLGAAVAAGAIVPTVTGLPFASGETKQAGIDPVIALLRPALQELARDTINGLTTFVVPGSDPYSKAQGVSTAGAGAIQAKTPDFLMGALDNFVPLPNEYVRPVAAALATAVADDKIPLPGDLTRLLPLQLNTVDEALKRILTTDETVPLSLIIAMTLNLLATQVNPASLHGLFVSPFSRLSWADKAKTMSLLEGTDSDLVQALDVNLPEPLHQSLSGVLKFVGGALIEFSGYGSFTEYAVYNKQTRTLTGKPVGWTITGYDGIAEGWDEFKGYYQGRKKVEG
ncbi:twin-arginine translocation signal domain-containing protein [Fodinicola feengrottensis]|uniref:Twin-arginine translocation signal domain-containing protein n=1 Tax=Fodinicola feengrottensis TaxID=435914 RepID=A0ABP4VBI6_9ACTN|nr:twin-arginine translocation signal domain-containing protein [Fodinicola feengrottensis]